MYVIYSPGKTNIIIKKKGAVNLSVLKKPMGPRKKKKNIYICPG